MSNEIKIDKKTILRILIRAKNILIKNKWTQESYARDEEGYETDYYSSDAYAFCAEGAVLKAKDGIDETIPNYLLLQFTDTYIRKHTESTTLIDFNDKQISTKKEAIQFFKDIITHYKAQL